ncbi:MAG: valine--tRNA ligase [Deltaproteobacteria bacterium]|nr:valine--tRNA ligase [Deltaproteobacteria bacterium]
MPNLRELSKTYEPAAVEPRWYAFWVENGFFAADRRTGAPRFCITIPPPNITGSLHMGHALTVTIEDIVVRWHRMRGEDTLWLPGTDHAGIATQMVVERELRSEGTSRHDLGREKFLDRVWRWKELYGGRINEQLKVIGASLDWGREAFTLSPSLSRAVREAFVRLHDDGLIYRDYRLINWCPRCLTALSDLEVDHEEDVLGDLWSFAYPLADGSGEIVVATTRPETMLGDTAIAVHPDDERHKAVIGKNVRHPLLPREFPVIADPVLVDMAFGTGAVKVTPGHDFSDFATGKRHGLAELNILNADGTLNDACGKFAGLDRHEARRKVKEDLTATGLFRGRKDHLMAIGRCQRCKEVVEPMLSTQWFVKTKPLAEPAIEAVEKGIVTIIPETWTKTYFHWMRNIQDWCISRQLWWGHQVPAWYCTRCSGLDGRPEGIGGVGSKDAKPLVAREKPAACPECGGTDLVQDPDVLDTWFSSALWPFSTLGWPDDTPDLKAYYPNDLMETGFDILFFWVARMMMMGTRLVHPGRPLEERVPFRTIYLHAMVRDEKGEKMSKTRRNVIDPLDVTAKHGADALRFTLASMATQGQDVKLSMPRVEGYRHFGNKLWNAARFAMMNLGDYDPAAPAEKRGMFETWIEARFEETASAVNRALSGYRFDEAANTIYHFTWHELCDWYIELSKLALYDGAHPSGRRAAQQTLVKMLDGVLRLLHPFMPYLSEEIWQAIRPCIPDAGPGLAVARFPDASAASPAARPAAAAQVDLLKEIVTGIRNLRGEHNIEPSKKFGAVAHAEAEETRATLAAISPAVRKLSGLSNLEVTAEPAGGSGSAIRLHVPSPAVDIVIPARELVDFDEEEARLRKEIKKCEGDLEGLAKRLNNPAFLEKAPAAVIEKDTARQKDLEQILAKAKQALEELAKMKGK